MQKCLGVELLLGVVELTAELCPRSAQGTDSDRLERNLATSLEEFLCAGVLLSPITPGVGTAVVSSSPLNL